MPFTVNITLPWVPEVFFLLLFAAKIEQRSRDRDRRFAIQFALQTTERKPLAPRAGLFKAGLR